METITTYVLIIGAGAAGIRAALAASESGVEVLVVTRGELARCARIHPEPVPYQILNDDLLSKRSR